MSIGEPNKLLQRDLVLLERKYRVLRNLEHWERLIDMCLVDSYDEMVRDLCGISYEDRLTTSYTNPSLLAPEEITNSESLILHRLRTIGGQKNIGCLPSSSDDCWETINVDKSVWNYSFEMNNWRYAHSSSQSSRRVFI